MADWRWAACSAYSRCGATRRPETTATRAGSPPRRQPVRWPAKCRHRPARRRASPPYPARPPPKSRCASPAVDTTAIEGSTVMKHIRQALLTALLLGAATLSQAHGTQGHGAIKKEQQVFGIAGDAARITRTVEIRMDDAMRFRPDRIEARLGETLRLRIHNGGQVLHELVIGTPAELDRHAALMLKVPGMEDEEAHMAHVPPGSSGEIVWLFNRAGEFDFACLIAGHYQAGMRGKIIVTSGKGKS